MKLNQTQQLLVDVNALIAAGAKVSFDVTADASRSYAYYDVKVVCTTAAGHVAQSRYNGSTVNSYKAPGKMFAQSVAYAVSKDVNAQFAARQIRAGSRIAVALREICDELATVEVAA